MKTISFSDFKRIAGSDILTSLPLIVTLEGVESFIVDKKENCLPISDLHPFMKAKFMGLWQLARKGETIEKVWARRQNAP